MRTASFLLRRVLAGVAIGLAVLAIGFYGWVRYRTSQYHRREGEMLAHYQRAYALCVASGDSPASCAVRAHAACVRDPFWLGAKPFSVDLRAVLTEATSRCAELG